MMQIIVTDQPFDPAQALSEFSANGGGAVVTFNGVVRNDGDDLDAMVIEHYPGMTEKALTDYAQAASERFNLTNALVIHRFGKLIPGEVIMMVATAAKHRKEAFQGADFLMDYLKSRAPFWKQEIRSGNTTWVDSKAVDEAALADWEKP